MAECLTVDQDVAGSTPVSHPKRQEFQRFLPFKFEIGVDYVSAAFCILNHVSYLSEYTLIQLASTESAKPG